MKKQKKDKRTWVDDAYDLYLQIPFKELDALSTWETRHLYWTDGGTRYTKFTLPDFAGMIMCDTQLMTLFYEKVVGKKLPRVEVDEDKILKVNEKSTMNIALVEIYACSQCPWYRENNSCSNSSGYCSKTDKDCNNSDYVMDSCPFLKKNAPEPIVTEPKKHRKR